MSDYPAAETAVLLVDPLNEFLSEGGKLHPFTEPIATAVGTVANLKRLVEGARTAGLTIAYALHHATTDGDYDHWKFLNPSHKGTRDLRLFEAGSFGVQVHPDVAPQPGDIMAREHWTASGFAGTDLDFLLRQRGIDRVVIAGNRASTCIDATGSYAVELGYHATLISDAIAAFNQDEMDTTIRVKWPSFGHAVLTTDEFLEMLG